MVVAGGDRDPKSGDTLEQYHSSSAFLVLLYSIIQSSCSQNCKSLMAIYLCANVQTSKYLDAHGRSFCGPQSASLDGLASVARSVTIAL